MDSGQAWDLGTALTMSMDGADPGGASAGLSSVSYFVKGPLGSKGGKIALGLRLNNCH